MSACCRGFSLTELLVATALLAVVSGGGITALARAHAVWREANLQQQLHERAQYVFATLEPGRAQWLGNARKPQQSRLSWHGDTAWRPADVATGNELRELLVRAYYVAPESDGDTALPALRVKSLTSISGVPAFVDTEVMHGIEQLRIEVLPTAAEPRSVRVYLRVRADASGAGAQSAAGTLQVERRFTLRNAG
jgi:prepilin-type N-terminal cleavage/methylation domain-containing protein